MLITVASRTRAATLPQEKSKRQGLPRLLNSMALISGRIANMVFGFLAWLLAARLFPAAEVGLASGAISAMMLCVQLALLGVGSAFIVLFPQYRDRPAKLLDTAFSTVSLTALLAACLFLLLASGAFQELSVIGSILTYTIAFLALSALGTVGVLFDQVSIALRRSDQVLTRNALFGLVTLVSMGVLPLLGARSSLAIFCAWVLGNLGACVLGFVQLWFCMSQYRYRPRMELGLARRLISIGLPNYALTLAERTPGAILPIIVTELLSPIENAYWYQVWMMAWAVYIIPISVGQTLFAEVAHRPSSLKSGIRHSVWSSLGFGVVTAIGVGVLAPFLLAMLGSNYAASGAGPLRVLVLGVLPYTFVQAYYAACRGIQQLNEAILTGMVSGAVGVIAAAAIGVTYGIMGMAVAWIVSQFAAGIWALWRLRCIARLPRQSESLLEEPAATGGAAE
ncbi:MAG TPA: hypothetical protein VFU22_15560 [Roseiflexaceae bacterium]|nr:hypothetical protein [Roseiflexaceae bacterium]